MHGTLGHMACSLLDSSHSCSIAPPPKRARRDGPGVLGWCSFGGRPRGWNSIQDAPLHQCMLYTQEVEDWKCKIRRLHWLILRCSGDGEVYTRALGFTLTHPIGFLTHTFVGVPFLTTPSLRFYPTPAIAQVSGAGQGLTGSIFHQSAQILEDKAFQQAVSCYVLHTTVYHQRLLGIDEILTIYNKKLIMTKCKASSLLGKVSSTWATLLFLSLPNSWASRDFLGLDARGYWQLLGDPNRILYCGKSCDLAVENAETTWNPPKFLPLDRRFWYEWTTSSAKECSELSAAFCGRGIWLFA